MAAASTTTGVSPARKPRRTRRIPGRLSLVGLLGVGTACGLVDGHFTPEQWDIIESLCGREAVADDPTNAVADDPRAAALGHALFFDPRVSTAIVVDDEAGLGAMGETGRVACADCHTPERHFSDARGTPTSLGVRRTPRNAPTILDLARGRWFLWDGRADSTWQAATVAVEAAATQNSNRLRIAHLLADDPFYAREYEALFGPFPASLDSWPADGKPATDKPELDDPAVVAAWDSLDAEQRALANEVFASYAKAVAAYCRLLVTGDSDFDAYVAGDDDAIDDAAKRGLELFVGRAGCVECHSGPELTDQRFHNLGLDQKRDPDNLDEGRRGGIDKLLDSPFNSAGPYNDGHDAGPITASAVAPVRRDDDNGAFRTPSLRNVAETGPYMHDGSLPTLQDVVAHYNWGADDGGYPGRPHPLLREPLGLSSDEQADLVAFLETLTTPQSQLPPAELLERPPAVRVSPR